MLTFNLTFINSLFVLALIIFCIEIYYEVTSRPRMRLVYYYLLRISVLGLLFWLFQAFWNASYDRKTVASDIVILRDISGSMELLPQNVKDDVNVFADGLTDNLKDNDASVKNFSFGSDVVDTDKALPPRIKQATAIGKMLLEVNQEFPGASIVLFSDGNENSGISALAAVRRIAAYMTSVYPVICRTNDNDNTSDISLSNVSNVLNSWNPDYCCILQGAIEQQGELAEKCVIEVRVDDELLLTREIELKKQIQNFELKVPAKQEMEAGWYEYSVTAVPLQNEVTKLNNTAKGVFKILGKDQINIIWQYWDLNIRFLKNALTEMYGKNVNVVTAATFKEMDDSEQIELLNQSELLVLGDIPVDTFCVEARDCLFKMLNGEKISLFFMNAGALKSWLQTPVFASLIPVQRVGKRLANKVPWRVRLAARTGKNQINLPVHTVYRLDPKKNSDVKLKAYKGSQKQIPIVVSDKRITCFAPTSTWRWFLSPEKSVHFDAKVFWNWVLGKYSFLEQGQLHLTIDEKKDVMSQLGDKSYIYSAVDRKNDHSEGAVFLMQQASKKESKEIRRFIKKDEDDYVCEYSLETPGIYWFIAQKRNDDNKILAQSKRVPIVIADDNRETNNISDKTTFLNELATQSNGQVFYLDQRAELEEVLRKPKAQIKLKKPQGHNYLFESTVIAMIVLLLGSEWLLRQIEKKM